jgi:scyllo-inositol 2-dehydrogenase (NADP+)
LHTITFEKTVSMTISVIGSGKIAGEVLGMLRTELPDIRPLSIFSHSNIERAESLAREYGIPHLYTDYGELLRCDTSDFLYIANVNTAHYAFAMKALEAGRNVIIEKPLCMTGDEAERLVATARAKGLMLIEAVSLLHMPNMKSIGAALPLLGRVRLVECDYSQYSSRYDRYLQGDVAPAFDPQYGGGALRDLNVYNLHFVVSLFGEPCSVDYHPNVGFNGVDTSGILNLHYRDFECVCSAAKDSWGRPYGQIQGEKGILRVEGPVNVLSGYELSVCNEKGQLVTTRHNANTFRHRLAHEFDAIRKMFEHRDYATFKHYQDISLAVMRILQKDFR